MSSIKSKKWHTGVKCPCCKADIVVAIELRSEIRQPRGGAVIPAPKGKPIAKKIEEIEAQLDAAFEEASGAHHPGQD